MKISLALPVLAISLFAVWSADSGTVVSVVGDEFHIDGKPTYGGRVWRGHKVQGLLLNARLVQGIFDDRNTNTVSC